MADKRWGTFPLTRRSVVSDREGFRLLFPVGASLKTAYDIRVDFFARGWWFKTVAIEFESFGRNGIGFAIKWGEIPSNNCRPWSNKHKRYMRPEEYA